MLRVHVRGNGAAQKAKLLLNAQKSRACSRLYAAVPLRIYHILGGSRHAKNVLRSFAANHAYDKFHEEVMLLPFNILVFTMKVTDDQYRFLMEKSKKGIDAALMNRVFLAEKEDELSQTDLAAAETACLWQCADRIVLLEQLPDDKLEQLAANRLDAIEKRLDADYGIEFRCGDRDRFIRLLLQSAPHELCPGELADLIDDMFGGLWRTVNRHPELKALELDCAELPEYLHDPARRLIRGDYLAFDRNERIDGEVLRTPKFNKDEDINHWCERIYRLIYRGGSPEEGLRDMGRRTQEQFEGIPAR